MLRLIRRGAGILLIGGEGRMVLLDQAVVWLELVTLYRI